MSTVDLESLRHLAQLARLALSDQELRAFEPELERILAAFAVLARHASSAPATADLSGSLHAREDRPMPSLARDELLAPASAHDDGYFVVPKTVGGEG